MPVVKKYKSKVEKVINPLPDVYTVTFSSDKNFKYLPGQFLHIALDEYDGVDQWPESRCFSMQSNPDEELIRITFSVQGAYTKRMAAELNENREVWLKLPYGDIFQRGHQKSNCVFIAGGTGITPFLSLFNNKLFNEYKNPVLYFGTRNKGYNIYNEELKNAKEINTAFTTTIIYQDEKGLLDINKIFEECNFDSTYFISGPPVMIELFKKYLSGQNVPESKIITDDWE
jgi:predicted ferric reductase